LITLRTSTPSDAHAIALLLAEMDEFYGATDFASTQDRLAAIRETIFSTIPAAHVLLACVDTQLVGFAAYSFLWPAAGTTKSLYLKELYVIDRYRREGVGRLMMAELCKIAVRSGSSRVEWTTDTDNTLAQRFYASLGASPNSSKLFYRVDGNALLDFAASDTSSEQHP
jgi:GNAT superfamily N-acetyltransferase